MLTTLMMRNIRMTQQACNKVACNNIPSLRASLRNVLTFRFHIEIILIIRLKLSEAFLPQVKVDIRNNKIRKIYQICLYIELCISI